MQISNAGLHWNQQAFHFAQLDRSMADLNDTILDKTFWGYRRMAEALCSTITHALHWSESCPCHSAWFSSTCTPAERSRTFHDHYGVECCPLAGCRAADLSNGVFHEIMQDQAHIADLPQLPLPNMPYSPLTKGLHSNNPFPMAGLVPFVSRVSSRIVWTKGGEKKNLQPVRSEGWELVDPVVTDPVVQDNDKTNHV